MKEKTNTAQILIESLPYIRDFFNQTIVIKYGGHAMIDEQLKKAFALNIVLLKYIGINPVIVHGGGPQIGNMLDQLNISCQFKEGLRVTDQATMDVVEMVLVGKVNKEIVNLVNLHGGRSVGLSGKDGGMIKARKMEMFISKDDAPPELLDLGKVGEVTNIDTDLVLSLQEKGFIPIIAPVGVDDEGETYNINADAVAGEIASALKAKRLMLLTDVPGVMDPSGTLISSMNMKQVSEYIENTTIKEGMIPKVKCCMEALESGVEKSFIVDGRVENVVLLELFTEGGIGTEIVASS